MTPSPSKTSSGSSSLDRNPHRSSHHHGGLHKAPEENVHTNILGRDGTDLELSLPSGVLNSVSSVQTRGDNNLTPSRSNRKSTLSSGGSSGRRSQEALLLQEEIAMARSSSSPDNGNKVNGATTPGAMLTPVSETQSPPGSDAYDSAVDSLSNPSNKKQSTDWWGKRIWGLGSSNHKNDSSDESHYDRMEAPLDDGQYSPAASSVATANASAISALPGLSTSSSASSAAHSHRTVPTVEDQLRQDCSFFYQGMDEVPSPPQLVGRKLMANSRKPQQRNAPSNTLNNIPNLRMLSSRDGAIFMNKYERLNQVIKRHNDDDDDDDYDDDILGSLRRNLRRSDDLFLDEYSGTVGFGAASAATAVASPSSSYYPHNHVLAPDSIVTDTLHSNLIYEQDGRVLMKLPRDQVRLMMDTELGPGILSVEQWRRREDVAAIERARILRLEEGTMTAVTDGVDPLTTKGGGQTPPITNTADETLPELYYVLTVPDDLYRRVVSEMSDAAYPPYWGFCCSHESEKADIKLALVILSIIMFLMMIGSLEWPTD